MHVVGALVVVLKTARKLQLLGDLDVAAADIAGSGSSGGPVRWGGSS